MITLKKEKSFLKRLLQHSLDLICIIDENGNLLQISDACEEIIGYHPNDLSGYLFLDLVHPEDREAIRINNSFGINGPENAKFDCRLVHQSGHVIYISWSCTWDAEEKIFFAIGHDASDRYTILQQLQEKEEIFKAFTENGSDMLGILDDQGQYKYIGGSTAKILGYDPKQLIGMNAFSLIHPEDLSRATSYWEELKTKSNILFSDYRFRTADGSWKWLETNVSNQLQNPALKALMVSSRDITERKNSELKLVESEQRFKALFENHPDMIFYESIDGVLLDANPAFINFVGQPKEFIIGEALAAFLPPETVTVCQEYLLLAVGGKEVRFELSMELEGYGSKHLIITKIPVSVQGSIIGVYSIIQDNTDKKINEAEMEMLSLVASKAQNGVLIVDKDRRIMWANSSFLKISGYTLSEILGKTPLQFLGSSKTDLKSVVYMDEQIAQSKRVLTELLLKNKSGDDLWLAIEVNPIMDHDGNVKKMISIQTDITEKKKSELELVNLAKDLYRQNRDLQQFTYIVSHNLRGPVANALGLTSLMQLMDKHDPFQDECLENLQKSVVQLDTILKDLNTVLSVRDNQNSADRETVEVEEVFRQALASFEQLLLKCGGKVVLEMEEGFTIFTIKAYLYSIFYNLISNAIKYRSDNRNLQLTIKCFGSPERGTVISFADNGSGMDLEKVGDKVFQLYKRFHNYGEGRGIGLFLIKAHVEAMNGQIEISSEVDKGTSFFIYLKQ